MGNKITLTIGLPASGKSTWAEAQNAVIACRDDIRQELYPQVGEWIWKKYRFTKHKENAVSIRQKEIVMEALGKGRDAIIADTNLNPRYREQWKQFCDDNNAEYCEKSFLDTPVHKCLEYDTGRAKAVGRKVILDMFDRWVADKPVVNPDLSDAIIVDVDGTLAHMDGQRGAYDWDKVGVDKVDPMVKEIVNKLADDMIVIIMTGRDGVALEDTVQWLKDHHITYDRIYIREANDMRADYIVKRELYDNHVRGEYNVRCVFDDRSQVVLSTWRALGLKCLQCANGEF